MKLASAVVTTTLSAQEDLLRIKEYSERGEYDIGGLGLTLGNCFEELLEWAVSASYVYGCWHRLGERFVRLLRRIEKTCEASDNFLPFFHGQTNKKVLGEHRERLTAWKNGFYVSIEVKACLVLTENNELVDRNHASVYSNIEWSTWNKQWRAHQSSRRDKHHGQ